MRVVFRIFEWRAKKHSREGGGAYSAPHHPFPHACKHNYQNINPYHLYALHGKFSIYINTSAGSLDESSIHLIND